MLTAITVPLLVIYSQVAISAPQAKRLTRQAIALVQRDVGVTITPRFRRRRDITQGPDLSNQRIALGVYSPFFDRESVREGELTMLLAPSSKTAWEQEASTGQAIICGRRAYTSVTRSHPMNVITMAHELGHMLGAEHTPWTGSIMDPSPHGAAWQNNWNISFTEDSVELIRRCMGA